MNILNRKIPLYIKKFIIHLDNNNTNMNMNMNNVEINVRRFLYSLHQ